MIIVLLAAFFYRNHFPKQKPKNLFESTLGSELNLICENKKFFL
jgi:hypothetical protein